MASHTLTIPNWTPTSLNRLLGMHWSRRQKVKDGEADLIKGYALQQQIPAAKGKRRVLLEMHGWGRGGPMLDGDNALKSLLDGLVRAGLLVDDGGNWCEWAPPVLIRSRTRKVVITLEDMDEGGKET